MFCLGVFLFLLLKIRYMKISRKSLAILEQLSCRRAVGDKREQRHHAPGQCTLSAAPSKVSQEGACHGQHTLGGETAGPGPQRAGKDRPLQPAAGREGKPTFHARVDALGPVHLQLLLHADPYFAHFPLTRKD